MCINVTIWAKIYQSQLPCTAVQYMYGREIATCYNAFFLTTVEQTDWFRQLRGLPWKQQEAPQKLTVAESIVQVSLPGEDCRVGYCIAQTHFLFTCSRESRPVLSTRWVLSCWQVYRPNQPIYCFLWPRVSPSPIYQMRTIMSASLSLKPNNCLLVAESLAQSCLPGENIHIVLGLSPNPIHCYL